MKLDVNCMRDILIQIEEQPFKTIFFFNELVENLPKYEKDELTYTCLKLDEGGLINISTTCGDNKTYVEVINCLTYEGHQFLANIRSDNIWNKTKNVLGAVGSTSVTAIVNIAEQVVVELIKSYLSGGLPK